MVLKILVPGGIRTRTAFWAPALCFLQVGRAYIVDPRPDLFQSLRAGE